MNRHSFRWLRGTAPALLVALATLAPVPAQARQAASPETLVMPFDSLGAPPAVEWLSEGAAVLLGTLLERYGAATVTRDERTRAFERLQLPPAAALSHATVIKIGQFVGAADVVIGTYQVSNTTLSVRARLIRLGPGRLFPEVHETGAVDDVLGVFDRVARALRGGSAPAPPPAAGTLLASAPAFEQYVKALAADDPVAARALLDRAAKLAPNDDHVKLALGRAYAEAGEHTRALEVFGSVPRTSIVSPSARYLAALSQLALKRFDEALTTLRDVQATARAAEVLNAMGVVQLRRGGVTAPSGRATYFFSQAVQTEPADGDYCFNLGYAYWQEKDPAAAVYWLREAVRRNPADGDAHAVLAAALQQTGATTEAARERELANRLSAPADAAPRVAGDAVPRGLERLKAFLGQRDARVDAVITSTGQRDQAELAAFHLEAGRRAYAREADREAEQELRRALYLSPYLADAQLLLGRIYLRAGRPVDAIQAFKIALWSAETPAGRVALAEALLQMQNAAAAKAEIDRALALDPAFAPALALRDKVAATLKPPR